MRRPRMSCAVVLLVTVVLCLSMTSCGGSGGGSGNSDLVLLGFNLPNLAGIPLNNPLIFTFSANVDRLSITPDTLRVTGAVGPFFEETVVDGNLVALIPTIPNFADYSDAGFAPATQYSVSMSVFPAPSTIETPSGKPLLFADSFTFVTLPTPTFIEHRRAINHGPPPSAGFRSDDEGCLNNSGNDLYVAPPAPGAIQTGSGPGATLLCLMNEGPPRVIASQCSPVHDQRAVGTPSAVLPGLVDLPALRIRLNEALDPLSVVPYISSTKLPVNMQLLRVAQKDETPIVPPEEIQTNQPLIVQEQGSIEIILVASGAVQQGIYCINLSPNIRDLAQNQLRTDDRPPAAAGGYTTFDGNVALPGWRLYFRTLELPATALAINETYSNNNREWGDLASLDSEPGIYTDSNDAPAGFGDETLRPLAAALPAPNPNYTLLNSATNCGQSTTANWNNGPATGYRLLNIDTLPVNTDVTSGADEVRAVWKPWCGGDEDIALDTSIFGNLSLDTTSSSADGDGIYEVPYINIEAGASLSASGDKPLFILCRGDCVINGTVNLSGAPGGHGLDTDGTSVYTDGSAIDSGGAGGLGGPGGGAGGAGANPKTALNGGFGFQATHGGTVHLTDPTLFSGVSLPSVGNFDPVDQTGGGGGGFSAAGSFGSNAAADVAVLGGDPFGSASFEKLLSEFRPDRGYLPWANVSGGMGGSGGSAQDNAPTGSFENGDHGGGGGGGAGGGLWIIVCGNTTVGPTGVIRCDGGAGGNTYAIADQLIDPGPDEAVGGGDDFVAGIAGGASPSGGGGPGGGGSGGSICLIGRGTFTVSPGAIISAKGGAGGMSGAASRVGGAGADGRIRLATFETSSADPVIAGATIDPIDTLTATRWSPPHEADAGRHVSVGQTAWIDLFTPTADFNPGGTNPPAVFDNFGFLTGAPFNLVQGTDFDAILEFQGAADLAPIPGGAAPPTMAEGLTPWTTNIDDLDNKRYIRWRWRFFVEESYPGFGIGGAPMPAVQDITIPYNN